MENMHGRKGRGASKASPGALLSCLHVFTNWRLLYFLILDKTSVLLSLKSQLNFNHSDPICQVFLQPLQYTSLRPRPSTSLRSHPSGIPSLKPPSFNFP